MKKLMIVLGLAAMLPLCGCASPYDTAYGGYDHGGGPWGGYGIDCPQGGGNGGAAYSQGYGQGGYYNEGPATYYGNNPYPQSAYAPGYYGEGYSRGQYGRPGAY